MSAHLNTVFDNWKAMESVSFRLRRLASSFEDVGNDHVADQLFGAASEIMSWANRVRDSHGEKLSEDLARTHEFTAGILTAMVTGIDMGKGSKP